MQTESTYKQMSVEHLGAEASEADLAAFVAACANYQAATGASDAAATDHIWHGGDCWARVAEWAPAEAAVADTQAGDA
jgi:hypothetical protein